MKKIYLLLQIILGYSNPLQSQDFFNKGFEYFHFQERPLNPFELNKFDSIVLEDAYKYFLTSINNKELLSFLKWAGLSYAMQDNLINFIISKYPNNESFILDNLDLLIAHPNSIRPIDIENYPILNKLTKDSILNLNLGKFLVNSDFIKEYINKDEISLTKKQHFIKCIENYNNNFQDTLLKNKGEELISLIKKISEENYKTNQQQK